MPIFSCKKKPAFVFDLEGTLSDHRWRSRFYETKQYDQYNMLFPFDGVNERVFALYNRMGRLAFDFNGDIVNAQMIILTAKSVLHAADTQDWIKGYLGLHHASYNLIMRPTSMDGLSSEVFKQTVLTELSETYDIKMVMEDRDVVIWHLIDCGFNVLDVKPLWQV